MVLRYGMIGGGGGFIGAVHRQGALHDDLAILCAGCFSRNPEKNAFYGEKWHIADKSRIYADYREMAEKESQREDGVQFVSITTPNNSHYEIAKCFMEHGIHVVCDKPLAMNIEEGEELQRIAKERDIQFGLTYTYSAYAVIRQAREMIRHGEIGEILHVVAEYPQDWVINAFAGESDQAMWRLDPAIAGESQCTADIGTHLEQLIVQMTGLEIKRVLARFDSYPREIPMESNTTVLLDFGDKITGTMWASQIAIGYECGVKIRVFGTKGSLEWCHLDPNRLLYTPLKQPTRILSSNCDYMYPESRRLVRLPAGHPEGFFEAFGNIYRSYCEHLLAKLEDREADTFTYPTIEDGVHGLKFVKACVDSNKEGNVWKTVS